VPLSRFALRPSERFLYEYDFTAGWQIEVRVERVTSVAPDACHRIPVCVGGCGVRLRRASRLCGAAPRRAWLADGGRCGRCRRRPAACCRRR
jgi:hypothetical protein